MVPTRELALQIFSEAKKYGKVYNITVICAYGGGNKYEQSKSLEQGAEIVIATPGRMIDMIKMKATNLERVTYLGNLLSEVLLCPYCDAWTLNMAQSFLLDS